ncbi:MAG: sulfotransferase [Chloroflexi bacterium]|nr:sulfotransferase [Chloroflexota bacterium]
MKCILLGYPRSGTSWLRSVLDAHPALRLVNEPLNGDANERAGEGGLFTAIRRHLGQETLTRYAAITKACSRQWRGIPAAALSADQQRDLQWAIHAFFQATKATGFKEVWSGLKVPLLWEATRSTDKDTRVLYLVRGFYGVLYSVHRRGFWFWSHRLHHNLYKHYTALSPDCQRIAAAFRDWTTREARTIVTWLTWNYHDIQAVEAIPDGHIVRYEDLVQYRDIAVDKVLGFLGLDMTPEVETALQITGQDATDAPYDSRKDAMRLLEETQNVARAYRDLIVETRRRVEGLRSEISRPDLLDWLMP